MAAPAGYERDLYEVLGLSCDCLPEEIRTAYKKLALLCHPDKLLHTGISKEAATAQFQELLQAYEVLSDPEQRFSYDYDQRSQEVLFSVPKPRKKRSSKSAPATECSRPDFIFTEDSLGPFFSDSAFCGYSDTGMGFYKVYSDLFEKLYAAENRYARKKGQRVRGAPVLGNRDSPETQVWAFYRYWQGFGEVKESGYSPKEEKSWSPRRKREEEEKKKERREYYGLVRSLADFVMERDMRVIDIIQKRMEKEMLMEMKKLMRKGVPGAR